jgi:diadenosine tetraphosphatase ApaH/serine/threonine PP2A family protein phosphatase
LPHRRWLIVAGAVGQPRDGDPDACYVMLDTVRNEITYHRVAYDIDAAAHAIRSNGLPEWLALRLYKGM